jgi:hypothetical protein
VKSLLFGNDFVQSCFICAFFHMVLEPHESLLLCYEINTNDFTIHFPRIVEDLSKSKKFFQILLNSIFLHQYKVTFIK